MKGSCEGSPIQLYGGGIQHCCMIAAAQIRFLRYWVDYYLYFRHYNFLFSYHLRRESLDVSVLLLAEELVACRKVGLEQLEQELSHRI